MSGRAQAANLTGMLSQIAKDVGEMGKAHEWTHNAIRTVAMPKVDETDPKSLEQFAEWARRNGKDDVAYAYSKRAADLAKENAKIEYAKGVAQNKEKIRGLLSDVDTFEATPISNNELYGTPGQLPVQAQINNAKSGIEAAVTQGNAIGESSRYGTGVEGSTALREVGAERLETLKQALEFKKMGLEIDSKERKNLEPVLQRIYAAEANQLQEDIFTLARTPNRTNEQNIQLDTAVAELNKLSADNVDLPNVEIGAGTKFLNAQVDQISQERSEALSQANARVTLQGNQRQQEINAEIDYGKRLGATLFADGIREIPPARKAEMSAYAIRAAETELEASANHQDAVEKARQDRTVSPEDLAYAENIAKSNPNMAAALKAYKKEQQKDDVFRRSSAAPLQNLIETHRRESGDAIEGLRRDSSIVSWKDVTAKYGDLTNWNDDIADILQDDEDFEAIKPEINKIMKAEGIASFENAGQFISIATQAARNLGYTPAESEESTAAVADTIDFANKVNAIEKSIYDEIYDGLEGKGYEEVGRVAKARRDSKAVISNVIPHMRQFVNWNDIGVQRMQMNNPDSPMSRSFDKISVGDGQTLYDVMLEAVNNQDTPVTFGQLGITYE